MPANPVISVTEQIEQCVQLLKYVFHADLQAVYLYGSAVMGGLQRYSDLDIFVVLHRASTKAQKKNLIESLLHISGKYMQDEHYPIELTIVTKSAIHPWIYPPTIDFQYGEWLREKFLEGNVAPWSINEMPDLALLITKVKLSNMILCGSDADQILPDIPYQDFLLATQHSLSGLMNEIEHDTRNVLLTLARIWLTLTTHSIASKQDAAAWALPLMPDACKPALQRALDICLGKVDENWNDVNSQIKPCADFLLSNINNLLSQSLLQ